MNRLGIVFKFEFKELILKRAMLISTLVISLLLFSLTFGPRIIDFFSDQALDSQEVLLGPTYSFEGAVIVAEDPELMSYVKKVFKEFSSIDYRDSLDGIEDDIRGEVIEAAYILKTRDSYTLVRKDLDMGSFDGFSSVLRTYLESENLLIKGIDPAEVAEAQEVYIDFDTEILGRDASQGFLLGFGFLFSLYILILMYGQLVATSVAREKDSRTMEILITSTNPKTLILGKVLAAGLVGVIQVLFFIAIIVLGFQLNKTSYPDFVLEMLKTTTSWDILAVYSLFSFAGYILYLFIFAALGSLVSRVEDVGTAILPVTVLFVLAYFVASTGMANPDLRLVKISSYIPFVSLFTTPIRYMMTSVAPGELLISMALMLASTGLIAYISVYIYRLGSLNYGNKISLIKLLKGGYRH